LYYKHKQAGLKVEKEKSIPLIFEEVKLESGYRIDLLVEDKLVIELKSVEMISELHFAQTLTYLRLGNFKLGLLLNFNSVLLKEGIRRVVNKL
jgi:GxxExxY protein